MFLNFEFPDNGRDATNTFIRLRNSFYGLVDEMESSTVTSEILPRTSKISVEHSGCKLSLVLNTSSSNVDNHYLQVHYKGQRATTPSIGPTGVYLFDTLLKDIGFNQPWVYHKDIGDPDDIGWNETLTEYMMSDRVNGYFIYNYLTAEIKETGDIISSAGKVAYQRLCVLNQIEIGKLISAYALINEALGDFNQALSLEPYSDTPKVIMNPNCYGIRPSFTG